MNSLPKEILLLISDKLGNECFPFLSINKKLYELRFEKFYHSNKLINLNKNNAEYIKKYYNVSNFVVSIYCDEIDFYLSNISNVKHRLKFNDLTDEIYTQSLIFDTLDLSNQKISKYINFKLLNSLNLTNTDISDISEISHIPNLNLSGCLNIKDFTSLVNNNSLDLSFTNISDVSNLSKVNKLYLNNCLNLSNIEPIKYVYELSLNYSNFILPVLFNTKLSLVGCQIYEFEKLINIKHLDISKTNIQDISIFINVYELIIYDCILLKKLEINSNIRILKINTEVPLVDFKNIYDLTLQNQQYVEISDYFTNVKKLDLSFCKNIIITKKIKFDKLNLSYTDISDVSKLCDVYELILYKCKKVNNVNSLYNVKKLDISYTDITDISNLYNVYKLTMYYCKYLKSIPNVIYKK